MSSSNKINVSKLLRVLVAGGLGLAGVAGATRAEENAPAPAEKTDKTKEKDQAKEKGKAETEKKKESKDKKAAEEKSEGGSDGGGVKGW